MQSLGYRCRLWTTAEGVEGVKGNQVLPLPLFQGDHLTFLRKFSHLSQDELELKNKKDLSVRYETKPDEDTKSRRLTRLLNNPSSVIKSVRHASPLLRPAHQLCPLDEKVHILPIPVGIWHVRH